MPIVSRGDDEDDQQSMAAAGAPPGFDVDFDPYDPDQVKVHYNLTGWSFEQRAELAETLAERGVPHSWEGDELVVPEEIESAVDALFDELEREIGPFPVPLLDDEGVDGELRVTEFDLEEWPAADIGVLQQSLLEAEIPHRWAGRTLVVSRDAEHVVDDLLDAIESGEAASLDESAEAPDGALDDLYVAADRLVRDAGDGAARGTLLALVPQLSPASPPFGLAARPWSVIVSRAQAIVAAVDAGAEAPDITAA
ncbi:MAG TPA: hypothetical protein VF065_01570, partial [Ilumatobacter sp.]